MAGIMPALKPGLKITEGFVPIPELPENSRTLGEGEP
jgi:hypothetical protein